MPVTGPAQPVPVRSTVTAELVLQRATYGGTTALRAEIASLGIAAWLGRQLSPAGIPDPGGDAVLAGFPSLSMSPLELHRRFTADPKSDLRPETDLQGAHLGRAMFSSRQLFEQMVAFWSDHFTVPVHADDGRLFRAHYDAGVIRPLALARFEDLLVAVTYSGSMMQYLNLNGSNGRNPNENFARELMELHTVGINGGYSEADIKQAAKLLTGWRINRETMQVEFVPGNHYVGPVTVMAFSHSNAAPDGGPAAARELLAYLAHHRNTAMFLATKLARHFVADAPPASLVSTLADTYLANDTQITPVLRTLFSSSEFGASAGAKLRRPMEHVAAVGRAVGLTPTSDPAGLVNLARALSSAGHAPFEWTTPDGYPDVAEAWQSAGQALRQFSLAVDLIRGRRKDAFGYLQPEDLLSDTATATTPTAVAAQLCLRFFGRAPSAGEAKAVVTVLSGPGAPATYVAGSPQQREACAVAALLLVHSPSFLSR